jgi:hypothetical protein
MKGNKTKTSILNMITVIFTVNTIVLVGFIAKNSLEVPIPNAISSNKKYYFQINLI